MPRISDENSISVDKSNMGLRANSIKAQDSTWTVVGSKNKKTSFPTFKDNKNVLANRVGENVSNKKPILNSNTLSDHSSRPLVSKHAPKPILSTSNKDNNKINVASSHPLSSVWAQKSQAPKVCIDCDDINDNTENRPPVRTKFGPSTSVFNTPKFPESGSEVKTQLNSSISVTENNYDNGFKYIEPRFVYDINCVVFVGNVAPTTTQDMLSSFFSQFGLVKSVNLKNAVTGRNRRDYAFIKFLVPESVNKVLNHKEPLVLDGATLEVRPRAGNAGTEDFQCSHLPSTPSTEKVDPSIQHFRTILVENIPNQWSPQFFYQCFTAYGRPTGCFIYDDLDSNGMKRGLIEMESAQTCATLCKNTGFLLLPNNVTVKVTLTSITNFAEWVKMHSQWLMYQQMWGNYGKMNSAGVSPSGMPPLVPLAPEQRSSNVQVPPGNKKAPAIVKASNVDIKAFKNSDEIFETFTNLFGKIQTSAIASIDSEGKAVVIFKVPDLDEAKKVKRDFDWYTFPGTPPEITFP